MAMWDKVRSELDRAGRAAQDAIDDGRNRLDAFRARQKADSVAQALGYAYFRARQESREIDGELYTRLSSELAAAEAEVAKFATKAEGEGSK